MPDMAAECGNPLYLQWIKEWLDLAKERNSKEVPTYKKAYDSMKACSQTFTHPPEARQLPGLGTKLCDRLTDKLKEHCTANGLPMPKLPHKERKRPSLNETQEAGPAKKPRQAGPYDPTPRSRPYALIIALSTVPDDWTVGLTMAETIVQAQTHCDLPFSASPYTAWTSMASLVEKGLVNEEGRPSRQYALTVKGWELAKRLKKVAGARDRGKIDKPAEPVRPGGSGAFVDLGDGSDGDDVLVQCLNHQIPTHKADIKNVNETIDQGQGLWSNPNDKFGVLKAAKERNKRRSKTDAYGFLELSSSSPAHPSIATKDTAVENEKLPDTDENAHSSTIKVPLCKQLSHLSSTDQNPLPSFQPIRLNPGTFTVELVLDNREIRARTDRDYIQDELRKKGVIPIKRSLELGDALWVAQCTDPTALTQHGERGNEIVLDWIVERKTLDDLVSSIKDGRFHEQKFRLRRSGLKNVTYIIEGTTPSHETSTDYATTIASAIASTQVVNGYFVKRTAKLDDTIGYLARMTRLLKSVYEPYPLAFIPSSVVSVKTYLPLLTHLRSAPLRPGEDYHVTYPMFAGLTSKSETLTVRDVFLKMLMCVKGITGEKALRIQRRWRTPRELVEALEECGGEENRRRLLGNELGAVVGRGKVGAALGAKVADVWGGGA